MARVVWPRGKSVWPDAVAHRSIGSAPVFLARLGGVSPEPGDFHPGLLLLLLLVGHGGVAMDRSCRASGRADSKCVTGILAGVASMG
jgi:hypothetical protein